MSVVVKCCRRKEGSEDSARLLPPQPELSLARKKWMDERMYGCERVFLDPAQSLCEVLLLATSREPEKSLQSCVRSLLR